MRPPVAVLIVTCCAAVAAPAPPGAQRAAPRQTDQTARKITAPMRRAGLTTDWYAVFREYNRSVGTRYSANPDGGILAWGAQYLLRMYVNLYEAFDETEWLDQLVLHADQMMANLSDVPRFAPYDPRYVDGYRGWGQNRYTQYKPYYTEWLGDDGLIISPILAFVELVYTRPALQNRFRAHADRYLRTIEQEIVAKWMARWEPDPGWTDADPHRRGQDAGYHVYEWAGWRYQPLNMYLSFTDALATLRRLSRLPGYAPQDARLPAFYERETRPMLQFFHDQLQYQPATDGYIWKYGPTSHWPELMEDVGHAFIDVQAALQGVQSGLVFTEADMRRMANTFARNVWNGSLDEPTFHYYVDGRSNALDTGQGHWGWGFLYLCGSDFRIWEAMAAYFEKHVDVMQSAPYIAVTTAMLAIAIQQHDTRAPAAPRDLRARRRGTGALLAWQPPTTDDGGTPLTGLQGYRVYRARSPAGPYDLLTAKPLKQLWYRDTAPGAADCPCFRVTAVDYRRPPNESPPAEVSLGPP